MKNIELTPRLKAIGDMVREGVRVADVGTDHAFLPLYLIKSGRVSFAIASDINLGPIQNAQSNIVEHNCQEKIKLVHCGGLDGVTADEVDDIIIAGMGGELISSIIDNAAWLKMPDKHLLLQPMTRANDLRRYLCENGFVINEERVVCEGRRLYTIISAFYCGKSIEYDDVFLYVGKTLLNPTEVAKNYVLQQSYVLRKAAEGMEKSVEDRENAVKLFDLSNRITRCVEEIL
ncbi:MAG: SAM-dependent methyltransferase [Clostridia bacterium]|nr:SAM-dependent methyltransferase [Clostridia bacterium]